MYRDFQEELKKIIDNATRVLVTPKPRYDYQIKHIPIIKYDLVIRDMLGRIVKELAWGLSLKDCLSLAKQFEKSKLIKESKGLYSLHYLKIEGGLYAS